MDRMARVNEMMKREIGTMIQMDIHNPELEFVTITNVNVSKDLQVARVSFSVLGDEKKVQNVTRILSGISGQVRKLVGQRIRLRYTPKIEFVYDKSIEYGAQIERALEEIRKENSGKE